MFPSIRCATTVASRLNCATRVFFQNRSFATSEEDPYKVLGVKPSATDKEIKDAYKRLAKENHPDRVTDEKEKEQRKIKLQNINNAYEKIKDAEKREQYKNATAFGGFGGFGGGGFEGFDFAEMFRQQQRQRPQVVSVSLSFKESIEGASKEVRYRNHEKEIKTIRIDIPKGIDANQTLQMHTPDGVVLHIRPSIGADTRFHRVGADLHVYVPLTVSQALLGGYVKVPLVNGETEIEIPAGIATGDTRQLTGRGAPVLNSSKTGNLIVHFEIITPKRLTAEQKKLMEEFAKTEAPAKPPSSTPMSKVLKKEKENLENAQEEDSGFGFQSPFEGMGAAFRGFNIRF